MRTPEQLRDAYYEGATVEELALDEGTYPGVIRQRLSSVGELIGAVYLDERMVYEFPMWLVDETSQVIKMALDTPATRDLERKILEPVKAACDKRMAEEGRD